MVLTKSQKAAAIAVPIVLVLVGVIIAVVVLLTKKKKPSPNPNPNPNPAPDNSCSSTKPCDAGKVCINGTCQTCNCQAPKICDPVTGSCVSQIGQTCRKSSDCVTGLICEDGKCSLPVECLVDGDCKDPTKPYCCLDPVTLKKKCNECCSTTNCNEDKSCVDGKCQPNNPAKSCANGSDCGPKQKCCPDTRICSECCVNTDCPPGTFCQLQSDQSRKCVPTPRIQGLSVPRLSVGPSKNWVIESKNQQGGSLVFSTLADDGKNKKPGPLGRSFINFAFQGNGDLTSGCSPWPSSWIGAFSYNGQGCQGQPYEDCYCPSPNPADTCKQNSDCNNGTGFCAGFQCFDTEPLNVPWVAVGGIQNTDESIESDPWLLIAPPDPDNPANSTGFYIVNVKTGRSVSFRNNGDIISYCPDGSDAGHLIYGNAFKTCSTGVPQSCSNVSLDNGTYCLMGTKQTLPSGGIRVPWLQIGSWTIYAKGKDADAKLFLEDSTNLKTIYFIASNGDILSYCRSAASVLDKGDKKVVHRASNSMFSKLFSQLQKNLKLDCFETKKLQSCKDNTPCDDGGLCLGGSCNTFSGKLSGPELRNFCFTAPPTPSSGACSTNSECTAPNICIGGLCRPSPL